MDEFAAGSTCPRNCCCRASKVKPKLLVIELWGLGDLVIATPFLRAAAEKYAVTLVAKPYALDLQVRLWPEVRVIPFVAPWTAFTNKYRFHQWPWRQILRLRKRLSAGRFDAGLSARWDPRDHFLLAMVRAKKRLGYSRVQSRLFLTQALNRPDPQAHRYEYWRVLAQALNFELPAREKILLPTTQTGREILLHSGAGQPVRVWPVERYRQLAARLRAGGWRVQVACDPAQRDWWLRAGETSVATPETVAELLLLIDRAGVFVGNDSGPGHLAAFCGVPPLTIFGPQLPEWFAPLHPASRWLEGKACPYKPCSDYCRFLSPVCLDNITEDEVFLAVEKFATEHLTGRG